MMFNPEASQTRAGRCLGVLAGLALAVALLGAAGCVQLMQRPGGPPLAGPAPTPTAAVRPPVATPSPPPSPTAPAPTPTSAPVRPPDLEVLGPADGSALRGSVVVVHGVATPGSVISVNGQPASVDAEGRFVAELALPGGPAQISVAAIDGQGNLRTRTISITVEAPQPFFLFVTEPRDQSVVSTRNIRLAGRTGVGALVSVNGVSIPVDGQGAFSTILTLEAGPNIIDVLSTSPEGQVLSAVVAIIYRA
jgi:hypothetical protein